MSNDAQKPLVMKMTILTLLTLVLMGYRQEDAQFLRKNLKLALFSGPRALG